MIEPLGASGVREVGSDWRALGAVALFFGLLTPAWFSPLPTSLGSAVPASLHYWDQLLNAHILEEARSTLWGGPYFGTLTQHPHAQGLAFSENLLTLSALSAPLRWLSSVGTHNVVQMLGFAATGTALFAFLRRRTVTTAAALIPAILFTFAPFRLGLLSKVQLGFLPFVPLLFLALERVIDRADGRLRDWALVALVALAQLGTCLYVAAQWAFLLGPYVLWLLVRRRAYKALAVGAVLVVSAALPVALPYVRAQADLGLERSDRALERTSGRWSDLATTTPLSARYASLAAPIEHTRSSESAAFPGGALLLTAALGAAVAVRRRGNRPGPPDEAQRTDRSPFLFGAGTFAAWAAVALLLFFGVHDDAPLPVYGWLHENVPGMAGLRYPSRFVIPLCFGLAGLSALGCDAALVRWQAWCAQRPGAPRGLPALLGVFVAVAETWTVPLPLNSAAEPWPARITAIAREGQAVLEVPLDTSDRRECDQNLAAEAHGRPTPNGYTGHVPPLTSALRELLHDPETGIAADTLRLLGVDRVVSNERLEAGFLVQRWKARGVRVYEVTNVPAGAADRLRQAVRDYVTQEPPETGVPFVARDAQGQSIPALSDGDPDTRWATLGPQRAGRIWFELELREPRKVGALWLDTRAAPADFPYAYLIEGLDGDSWRVLGGAVPHLPLERVAAVPARSWDVLRWQPATVSRLRLICMFDAEEQWGSAAELRVEAAD